MVSIDVLNECTDFDTYRSARVKSLFNVESGASYRVLADLNLDEVPDWGIGVVVGPSGSGKTTIGKAIWNGDGWADEPWPDDLPIVEAIAPNGDFDAVTGALSAVGLGDVPAWLRPYRVLSTGQKFRADLARIVSEAPDRVVVDEFTSTVDRQIARIGAGAFAKAWKRTGGQAVLLTCHYDVLDWLEPDWVFDTGTGKFHATRGLRSRPILDIGIRNAPKGVWSHFEEHHYMKAEPMPFSKAYIAEVDGQAVAHIGVSSRNINAGRGKQRVQARACRLVVLPEWQGAGVGMKFLNTVAQMYRDGDGHLPPTSTIFHTSHPGLIAALTRSPKWARVSRTLGKQATSAQRIRTAAHPDVVRTLGSGHLRGVTGFTFVGAAQ